MTIQRIGGSKTLLPDPHLSPSNVFNASLLNLDAAGEAVHYSGQIFMANGGTKTLSSEGGKIHLRSGATVFSDAGTTIRVGLQNTSTTSGPPGRGDGTFTVYADLVGGTDTISSQSPLAVAMETGSQTLSHGDHISVVVDMLSRGGSDVVINTYIGSVENTCLSAALASYLSSTWARVSGTLNCCIEFDDGTFGWIYGSAMFSVSATTLSFNSGTTTADEYGNVIESPLPIEISGVYAYLQPTSSTADFEICLYADPFGTPTLIDKVAFDATQGASSAGAFPCYLMFATPQILKQNAPYAITIRPTTTGNVTVNYFDVATPAMLDMYQLGRGCYAVRRVDNAGAFSEWNGGTAKTRRLVAGVIASGFHDAWGESRAQSMIGV